MLVLAAATPPYWVVVVLPTATLLVACLVAFAAYYPHLRDRRAHQEAEHEHRKRLEATADAVLGRDGDPYVGRSRIVGLNESVPALRKEIGQLQRTLGHVNGAGLTVMELIAEGNTETKVVKDALEIHIGQDNTRFGEVNQAIGAQTATLGELRRQLGRE